MFLQFRRQAGRSESGRVYSAEYLNARTDPRSVFNRMIIPNTVLYFGMRKGFCGRGAGSGPQMGIFWDRMVSPIMKQASYGHRPDVIPRDRQKDAFVVLGGGILEIFSAVSFSR